MNNHSRTAPQTIKPTICDYGAKKCSNKWPTWSFKIEKSSFASIVKHWTKQPTDIFVQLFDYQNLTCAKWTKWTKTEKNYDKKAHSHFTQILGRLFSNRLPYSADTVQRTMSFSSCLQSHKAIYLFQGRVALVTTANWKQYNSQNAESLGTFKCQNGTTLNLWHDTIFMHSFIDT